MKNYNHNNPTVTFNSKHTKIPNHNYLKIARGYHQKDEITKQNCKRADKIQFPPEFEQ